MMIPRSSGQAPLDNYNTMMNTLMVYAVALNYMMSHVDMLLCAEVLAKL